MSLKPVTSTTPHGAGALAATLLLACGLAHAQPASDTAFDALLRVNVANGSVRYAGFAESPAFRRYVEGLGRSARGAAFERPIVQCGEQVFPRGGVFGVEPQSNQVCGHRRGELALRKLRDAAIVIGHAKE